MVHLHASQSVEIAISPAPVPIYQYLSDTDRLVYALADPSQIKRMENHKFQFSMRPIKFLMLTLEPVADVQIYPNERHEVIIYSDSCRLRHQPSLNRRFSFKLQGWLAARSDNSGVSGNAELDIAIDLPPAFRLTPKSLLESTGNAIVSGILSTIKQRLQRRLIHEYRGWSSGVLASSQAR
ncbi:DUF1997 domain-containing protein [Leptolyngbya cf. ectocarpi LEGE 11479]|uniref:DUF1997 domain-containing protein n=1 Tax=Leptolyngbya cf. ectocarpi LEGE 11479 TaxID=1828722 RepID=A0A928ZT15_LEPEC|nr:DUF1997 domain-containing protein [Leptolyngbya ectocarpi]MBE9066191.1 DUF1997 domain-containing protein [Leptolyngbya cf. ectocarpi LEGE 11479]